MIRCWGIWEGGEQKMRKIQRNCTGNANIVFLFFVRSSEYRRTPQRLLSRTVFLFHNIIQQTCMPYIE